MNDVTAANELYKKGNYHEALKLYEHEAKNGNTSCQSQLGFMYYQGKGIKRDLIAAENWLQKALKGGYREASVGLFRIFVERAEYDKAIHQMRQMARKRYPPAIYWLGRMYQNGHGIPRNSNRALIYFSLAARYGNFVGMRDRTKLLIRGVNGFFARFIGVYELIRLILVMAFALRKNLNDERQLY